MNAIMINFGDKIKFMLSSRILTASDNEILHLSQVLNQTLDSDSHFAMKMDLTH